MVTAFGRHRLFLLTARITQCGRRVHSSPFVMNLEYQSVAHIGFRSADVVTFCCAAVNTHNEIRDLHDAVPLVPE